MTDCPRVRMRSISGHKGRLVTHYHMGSSYKARTRESVFVDFFLSQSDHKDTTSFIFSGDLAVCLLTTFLGVWFRCSLLMLSYGAAQFWSSSLAAHSCKFDFVCPAHTHPLVWWHFGTKFGQRELFDVIWFKLKQSRLLRFAVGRLRMCIARSLQFAFMRMYHSNIKHITTFPSPPSQLDKRWLFP